MNGNVFTTMEGMTLLDGKALAEKILSELAKRIKSLREPPRLAAVLVGDDLASRTFLKQKEKACAQIGAEFRLYEYPAVISATGLSDRLNQIVREGHADGMIIQLPLPPALDRNRHAILRMIPETLDVDALTERAHGRLASRRLELQFSHGKAKLLSPFARTLLAFFEEYHINPEGEHAVLVGWGDLIGKVAAPILIRAGATVTICTKRTIDLGSITRQADLIISGTGNTGLITGDMVKDGVIAIDAGSTMADGNPRGDIDFDSVAPKASYITPVPGGVGPMVVAMLLANLVDFAEAQHGRSR